MSQPDTNKTNQDKQKAPSRFPADKPKDSTDKKETAKDKK